jgi:hypothetical protein
LKHLKKQKLFLQISISLGLNPIKLKAPNIRTVPARMLPFYNRPNLSGYIQHEHNDLQFYMFLCLNTILGATYVKNNYTQSHYVNEDNYNSPILEFNFRFFYSGSKNTTFIPFMGLETDTLPSQ